MIKLNEYLKCDLSKPSQMIPNVQLSNGVLTLSKENLGSYRYVNIYIRNQGDTILQEVVNGDFPEQLNDLTL